ncbi:MAG: hypothetical protein JSW62_04030 [Thermoplasmatales archaeon]|nr:MAG: hypothetical protein JSW62_04030 [Thermoplasmatales archaeon]
MSRIEDGKLIKKIPKEKIADFIFMHLRNMWAVDGLYYLEIEKKFGTKAATEIDRRVWEIMGKIEARKLKKFLKTEKSDIPSMMDALSYSGWALDLEDKEISVNMNKAILRNIKCRVQNTRLEKGLKEFGCKSVRYPFLKSFAKEFNPDIEVKCNLCPPDDHPDNLWCEWEFRLRKSDVN